MKSIIQENKDYCYLCGRYGNLQEHHVFNGTANRKKSEEDGMKVYVHFRCHEFIHSHQLTDLNLKAHCQQVWQDHYKKSNKDFIKRYGKDYIEIFNERFDRCGEK